MRIEEAPVTPAQATLYGLAAGFTATVLISALTRLPLIRPLAQPSTLDYSPHPAEQDEFGSPMSPAGALVQAAGPGPEGPAGLFAAKAGSGLFGRDLAKRAQQWGRFVHFAYGSFWGMSYGILQNRRPRRPLVAGVAHGLFIWALGPALLVPAMKLAPAPTKATSVRNVVNVVGHLIYGVTIAAVFNRLTHTGARDGRNVG